MWSYFRGWKRNVGVVTLAIATLFLCGWINSIQYLDSITAQTGEFPALISGAGRIFIVTKYDHFDNSNGSWTFPKIGREEFKQTEFERDMDKVRWTFLQIGFGTGREIQQSLTIWMIPHWSIVVPLTAISTWCLLSKSRHAKTTAPKPPLGT
jgi:hypothetical protein